MLPEWSRVKSTVATCLTACSKISYASLMSDLLGRHRNMKGYTVSSIIAYISMMIGSTKPSNAVWH